MFEFLVCAAVLGAVSPPPRTPLRRPEPIPVNRCIDETADSPAWVLVIGMAVP